ncbi:MAG: hypothetical protein LC778_10880 [Acidobacteria bacterium]|nr:hypothetical protein [Acidobacteriota bacterium]
MTRNKIQSLIVFAFLFFAFAFSVFAQDESRVSKTWEVQKYDITATLPQTETDRNLTARAILNLKNVSGGVGSRLTLRISPNAEIAMVKVNEATADFSKGEEKIGGNNTLQRILVRLPSIQPNQTFSVVVDYKLNVKENSGLNALSPIGSQFLPLSFWYPTPNSWYFARGADFAPVRLQVNAPNGQTVVSSGMGNANSFEQKLNGQPFFVTGNWDAVNTNNVVVFTPKGAGAEEQKRGNELANLASEAKTFVANLLGNTLDVPLRIVAVKRGAGFSAGGTVFVDESAFRRQKIDSQTAMTITEAVAKIWLGNAVNISGDANGVIREGLSRYIATQFLESKYGKEIADIERLRQRTAYATIVNRDAPLNIISPLDDYYYNAVGNKGAMIWRALAKTVGQAEFFNQIRVQMKDGSLELTEIRSAFLPQKEFLDHAFEKVTDTNLLIGLPQASGAETKIALRNAGSIDVTVDVNAVTVSGENLKNQTIIPAKSFGEVRFKTANKIVRVEVDSEKLYPQIDYSDDVAPREFNDNDLLLAVKRLFDKQDFPGAEKIARTILKNMPRLDDVRVFLARALFAQGRTSEVEKEFQTVLDEKLPTARSLAWANLGLGETALKSGNNAQAAKFFEEAIKTNAEYGAVLTARQERNKTNGATVIDQSIKDFFVQFDKAVISGRKADVDAMIVSGEIPKFAAGIAGQAEQWQTRVLQVDKIDASNIFAEVNLTTKFLNKNNESGTAVFRLSKIGNNWKLSGVEIFEVR